MSPSSIAHYRITAKLGEGGMGEVYRATDTKLNREVAIKILPESVAHDADRLARFTREAQVLASLNHPNIAAIYGVEERALVMELIEGQTLAERIAQGSIPAEEAVPVARQIAEALEYAHERGIIHRDLKPANVKITPDGRVKLLDFGLAKALSPETAPADPLSSPTLTMRATVVGAIMGTAAYMSPEQARGQAVDRRADIWAFGVMFHEMLTGCQLFAGPTISDTLAAVLKSDVDTTAVPAHLRFIVDRCLRRDLRTRWQAIGDIRIALEEGTRPQEPTAPSQSTSRWPMVLVAVLAILLAATGLLLYRATRPVAHPLARLSVDLGAQLLPGFNTTVVISPDGQRLVFPARSPDGKQLLAIRVLDQPESTLLPGTENAFDPFFSPDSQWIGFFTGNKLKKVAVNGGIPESLCPAQANSRGASWSPDGTIIFAGQQLGPLSRVSENGGTPQFISKLEPGISNHRWPQVLPGGRAVLFTAAPNAVEMDSASIKAVSLKTGQIKLIVRGGYYGRYVPSGHLVYMHQGVLYGVAFDAAKLETKGTPVPLVQDVASNSATGGGQFDFTASQSGPGTFLYMAGKGLTQSWTVDWLDASGKIQPLLTEPASYLLPRFSPDGRKLAYVARDGIYVHDIEHDTSNQISFSSAVTPVWTPDGKHIAIRSAADEAVVWIRSDGAGEPQRLLSSGFIRTPWAFSPDGKWLAYFENNPETGYDIWTVPLDLTDPDHPKPGKPVPFLVTPNDELTPRFSPDGRWVAYRSNETGISEVFVRAFPPTSGGKWQISTGGANYGMWSNDGRELFYETGDGRIMVMDYTASGDSFVPGKRRVWYDKPLFYPGNSNLDLAPDGKRFAVLSTPEALSHPQGPIHITFLLNFFDDLRRRIP